MREGMAEMGAPEGFEDVVASIVAIPGDQPDTPAHWGVTFAVDDADAIAERATELGGEVVVPPIDAPWVRMTVISDPQGATFIASKFVPENKDLAAGRGSARAMSSGAHGRSEWPSPIRSCDERHRRPAVLAEGLVKHYTGREGTSRPYAAWTWRSAAARSSASSAPTAPASRRPCAC